MTTVTKRDLRVSLKLVYRRVTMHIGCRLFFCCRLCLADLFALY